MELNKLKNYLKVDDNEDDELIKSLCLAAEEYLSNAGIEKNYEKELYSLAIKLLVSHWYDNRMIQDVKGQRKLSFSLDVIIMQLSL